MEMLRLWRWLLLAALAALTTAFAPETLGPANFTNATKHLRDNSNVKLWLAQGDAMASPYEVIGLTSKARSKIPPVGLAGKIYAASTTKQGFLEPGVIALISCDPTGTELGPTDVLNQAITKDVAAVLFWSTQGAYCEFEDYSMDFSWIYSMKSVEDSKNMENAYNAAAKNGPVYAQVGYPGSVKAINGTASADAKNNGNKKNGNNPLGPAPTTAVAMIILYAITGLITALFLVIIATGALRAHRHPERYGPRNVIGRPRQSRAKGLARALLETLPIVKFGDGEDATKPTDVELADTTTDGATANPRTETEPTTGTTTATTTEPTITTETRRSLDTNGIASAIPVPPPQSADPNSLGCSICTEDFETGQDQRVLPCNHKFHPECVDPWLLNVSGTCPLCRIDLRPEAARGEDGAEGSADADGEAPPLLAAQATEGERHRMSVRRSLVLGLLGTTRPDRMDREERMLALRQLRRRSEVTSSAVAETPEEQTRTRRRLRDVLGIRTRRAGTPMAEVEEAAATSEPAVTGLGTAPAGGLS